MKLKLFLTSTLTALLLAGCSTAPTKVTSGPIAASTFSFVASKSSGPDRFAQVHAMIQNSITQDLGSKGLKRVDRGGDVVVAYLVVVGTHGVTQSIDTYFGYGRSVDKLENKASTAYGDSKNPNYYEAGTLLVDIIDGKSDKLLKRSYVVRPLLRDPTVQARAEHIQEAVDAVLADLRIGR
jgi:hypothetical protein